MANSAMPSMFSGFKATEDSKVVQINAKDLTKTVQIKADLSPKQEGELIDFLCCKKGVFAWWPAEMLGVSRQVTKHTNNIKPESKTFKQGLRCFNQEKHKAMCEELATT
jgi:hypothetical protein